LGRERERQLQQTVLVVRSFHSVAASGFESA